MWSFAIIVTRMVLVYEIVEPINAQKIHTLWIIIEIKWFDSSQIQFSLEINDAKNRFRFGTFWKDTRHKQEWDDGQTEPGIHVSLILLSAWFRDDELLTSSKKTCLKYYMMPIRYVTITLAIKEMG